MYISSSMNFKIQPQARATMWYCNNRSNSRKKIKTKNLHNEIIERQMKKVTPGQEVIMCIAD